MIPARALAVDISVATIVVTFDSGGALQSLDLLLSYSIIISLHNTIILIITNTSV